MWAGEFVEGVEDVGAGLFRKGGGGWCGSSVDDAGWVFGGGCRMRCSGAREEGGGGDGSGIVGRESESC